MPCTRLLLHSWAIALGTTWPAPWRNIVGVLDLGQSAPDGLSPLKLTWTTSARLP